MNDLTATEARETIEAVRRSADELTELIRRLWDGRAWLALGYGGWRELVDAELRPVLSLPKSDRGVVMLQLQEAGMSNRAIADTLDVAHTTVGRSTGANAPVGRKTAGRDGRRRPTTKGKPHEIKARREHVRELFEAGYTRTAMTQSLDCAAGTIDSDLAALGVVLGERTVPLIATVPPPRVWRDTPLPPRVMEVPDDPPRTPRPDVPRHLRFGSLLDDLRDWQARYDEERWALRACHHVDSAVAAQDAAWLNKLAAVVAHLREDLGRIERAITDPVFRDAQSRVGDGSPPDSEVRHLRGVQ